MTKNRKEINNRFVRICENGTLDEVRNYVNNNENQIDLHYNKEKPFRVSCKNGKIDIARWLMEKSQNSINVNANDDESLKEALKAGYDEIAEWLINNFSTKLKSRQHMNCMEKLFLKTRKIYKSLEDLDDVLVYVCFKGLSRTARTILQFEFFDDDTLVNSLIEASLRGFIDVARYILENYNLEDKINKKLKKYNLNEFSNEIKELLRSYLANNINIE